MGRTKLAAALAATALGFVTLGASPAAAHVEAEPGEVEAGAPASITFTVPNEREQQAVEVVITMPQDQLIESVTVEPIEGWDIELSPADDGPVTSITLTATDGGLAPEEILEVVATIDPVPVGADVLVFKTLETYDDGEVDRWIDDETGAEPAPSVQVVAATSDDPAPGSSVPSDAQVADEMRVVNEVGAQVAQNGSDIDDLERIAWSATGLAFVAILAAIAAFLSGRRED